MTTILNNGIKMPMFGLGVYKMTDEDITYNAVKAAIDYGYRGIDTAAIYNNEEFVGRAIKESDIPREEIFLTTKVWNENQRQHSVQEAFQESIKKLQVDYVDLYLIHWPVKECFKDTWKVLGEIYKSGKAKAIGVSNFKIHHLEELKEVSDIVPAVNQVELHPYLSQKELLEYCNKENIKLQAYSPLGASKLDLFENSTLKAIADKYKKSIAQIILRWNIDCGIITIPKSENKQRIRENIDIFDFKLEDKDIDTINALNKNERIGSDPDDFNF